jgi:hypothetical protein
MHHSEEELQQLLISAASQVVEGGLYYHYKHPDKLYKVLKLAITEADNLPCVIYEAQYGSRIVFVRPLTSWLEKAQVDGTSVDRFVLHS